LTRGRRRRSWSLVAVGSHRRARETTRDVRGRSHNSFGEENAPMGWAARESAPTPRSREGTRRNTVWRRAEAGHAPSSAGPTGVGSSQDGPAPRGTYARLELEASVSRAGGRNGHGVYAAKAACSVTERFTGARVVRRLQMSVRSIFPEPPRGAARQTEAERGSASRRSTRDEGGSFESGDKGARSFARTVTGTASLFARSQDRESSWRKALWAQARHCL
jgi:hypothetical protein